MINTTKSIKEQLQSLLERGLVDESFVEDVRDALLLVDDDEGVYPIDVDVQSYLKVRYKHSNR